MNNPTSYPVAGKGTKSLNMSIRPLSPSSRYQEINMPTQPIRHHVHHVAVQDADASNRKQEPLSAYMVPSQYLPRDVIARVAPKRPLGQPATTNPSNMATAAAPESRKFHNQLAATMPAPMRIRRSRRHVPVVAIADDGPLPESYSAQAQAPSPAATSRRPWRKMLLLGIGSVGALFARAGHAIAKPFQSGGRVHYSAYAGAKHKRLSLADNRLKFGAAVLVFLLLFSFGLFGGVFEDMAKRPTPVEEGGSGGNGGSAVLEVNGGNGNTNGGNTTGNNPQSAASQRTQGATGPSLQPSQSPSSAIGSPVPVGGRGGGPDPSGGTTPTVSTGDNTIPEALPTPPAASPLLQNAPNTPLPVIITTPPENVSAGGKTIVDSSGTTVTVN